MVRIAFTTLGCKTNHYDSDVMARACTGAGCEVVEPSAKADVCVINTCAVTRSADARARNMVRCMIRRNPDAVIIVAGCGPEVDAETYKKMEGVSRVLGVRCADELADILGSGRKGRGDLSLPHLYTQNRARAFLKIQDGCNKRCAYCIVPFARGRSKSRPPEELLDEARALFDSGFGEIILTGVHVGRYGEGLAARCTLADLVKKMIEGTDSGRIRISSLDPDEIDDGLAALFFHPRVCRHLHLSLQSGSENVLKMMGRSGGVQRYADLITKISRNVPGISIGADIIAGFPGETDADFEETLDLVKSLPFTYLQVFPYSERPGTKAAAMEGQVPFKTRRSRAARLQGISAGIRADFYGSHVGQSLDVIVVSRRADGEGHFKSISDNYVPVMIKGRDLGHRRMYKAMITDADKERVYGTIA